MRTVWHIVYFVWYQELVYKCERVRYRWNKYRNRMRRRAEYARLTQLRENGKVSVYKDGGYLNDYDEPPVNSGSRK